MKRVSLVLMILAVQTSLLATVSLPADRTVHAEWSSWTAVEVDGETYYTPDAWEAADPSALSLADAPDAFAFEGVRYAAQYDGRENVMVLEGLGYWTMDFFMPNYSGGDYKEIVVEVTYQQLNANPIVGVEAYVGNLLMVNGINGPYSLGRQVHEGDWVTDAFHIVVTPNCDYEFVTLGFEAAGEIGVDSVVIDTVCVPEPATLGLMALGALLFTRRRK